MSTITLDDVIQEEMHDPEFANEYQKQVLINAISKMVTEMRFTAHLTQAELAKRAGTTQPVIARLESGSNTRVPSLQLLTRIARAANAKLNLSFQVDVHLENNK